MGTQGVRNVCLIGHMVVYCQWLMMAVVWRYSYLEDLPVLCLILLLLTIHACDSVAAFTTITATSSCLCTLPQLARDCTSQACVATLSQLGKFWHWSTTVRRVTGNLLDPLSSLRLPWGLHYCDMTNASWQDRACRWNYFKISNVPMQHLQPALLLISDLKLSAQSNGS